MTIDDLCLSVIVPLLMEKIRDGKNPRSSIKSKLFISAQRPSDPPHPFQNGLLPFHVHSDDHLPSLPDLIKQLPKLLSEKMLLDETSLQNAVWDQDYWRIITR